MKTVQIILASTRQGRAGKAVAAWVESVVSAKAAFHVELVDLLDYPLPALDTDLSPVAGKSASQLIEAWSQTVKKADGYIIVSPEYNHGYSGTLKNALDLLKDEWVLKPVAIVGYGGLAGGARSMEQLRLVLTELKMRPTYSLVLVPMVWEAFDAQGKPKHTGAQKQLDGVTSELERLLL